MEKLISKYKTKIVNMKNKPLKIVLGLVALIYFFTILYTNPFYAGAQNNGEREKLPNNLPQGTLSLITEPEAGSDATSQKTTASLRAWFSVEMPKIHLFHLRAGPWRTSQES